MLLGLALIAVPLLVAVLNAAVQMRQIASTSEKLVVESVRATRATQELFAEIAAVERGTRVYQVLRDPKLTESITRSEARLSTTRVELARHLRGPEATQALADLAAAESQLLSGIARPKPTDVDFASLLALLDVMQDAAARIAATGNAQIDAELTELRELTRRAQRRLLVQSSLLVPLSLIAILALTLSIGRPLRQIDRAISELGRGAFTHPRTVSGPRDLERLGHQLEWLRV